jgi:hypothetical protein
VSVRGRNSLALAFRFGGGPLFKDLRKRTVAHASSLRRRI